MMTKGSKRLERHESVTVKEEVEGEERMDILATGRLSGMRALTYKFRSRCSRPIIYHATLLSTGPGAIPSSATVDTGPRGSASQFIVNLSSSPPQIGNVETPP